MALDLTRSLPGIKERPLALQWLGHCPLLASAGQGQVIRIHHSNGSLLQNIRAHSDSICSLKWLPEHNKLASASFDKQLKIWDVETGKCMRNYRFRREVGCLEWVNHTNQLAAGGEDLRFFDIRVQKEVDCITKLQDPIVSLSWSNEFQSLAAGSIGNSITQWDISAKAPLLVLKGHKDFVKQLEWIEDRRVLASSSRDGSFKLWDFQSARCCFSKTLSFGSTVVCNLGGFDTLVSSSNDRSIKLWNLSTMRVFQSLDSPVGAVSVMSWNADELLLATACYFNISLYSLSDKAAHNERSLGI
mmetsp:Transcript_12242/g.23232  ORF Transcript_12242/g.23232 Transcript_12242/m.23232 type:complete len:302 (+) Transcript_12242:408-1313(+)